MADDIRQTPPSDTSAACCGACAEREAVASAPIAVGRPSTRPIRRDADRRVALGSIAIAGTLVAASVGTALAGAPVWVSLHLILAGAASTAIAGVLPFFAAALATAPPSDARVRVAAVVLVGIGALGISSRILLGAAPGWWVPLGGAAFVGGLVLVLAMTARAIRAGLGARRPVVAVAYVVGLVDVLVGATIATLFVAGHPGVLAAWAALRPAHAWLNLVGFVSLIVAGTLLHLFPTVAGTRIVDRWSGRIAIAGLAVGPPLVATGLVLGAGIGDVVARLGAVATVAAAVALAVETVETLRSRGRWTTDAGWHLASTGSLAAAVAWFAVGLALAAGSVMVEGAGPAAWSTSLVAAPLAIGWVAQALVGSWTHLVPAIGPGGPAGHARRRAILGRGAAVRLVARNVGIGLLLVGGLATAATVTSVGALLVAVTLASDLALAGLAVSRRGPGTAVTAPEPAVTSFSDVRRPG